MSEKQSMVAVISNVSESNGWYTVELADGKKLSTKIRDIAVAAHGFKGKSATIEYTLKENTKDGKTFKNYYIGGVKEASAQADPFAKTEAPAALPAGTKDDSIIRQTVVKAVGSLLGGSGADKAQVLAWCETLYGWVKGTEFADVVMDEGEKIPFGEGPSDDIPF